MTTAPNPVAAAPPPNPVVQMVADPDFAKMDLSEQRKALTAHDPDFGQMGDADLVRFVQAHNTVARMAQPTQFEQERTPQTGALSRFVSGVGSTLRSMAPTQTPSIGDAVKQGLVASTGAGQMLYGAGKEAIAASQRGHGLPYSAAAGLSSLIGVNPQAMEQSAERGDSAGILGQAAIPTAAAVLPSAVKGISGAIPNSAAAATRMQGVESVAGPHPIDISAAGDAALKAKNLQQLTKATLPAPIRGFLDRATDPNAGPMTFTEGRELYKSATKLSAQDYTRLSGPMKATMAEFTSKLGEALNQTADKAGQLEDYRSALREYHNAMNLKDVVKTAKGLAVKGAITGLGVGAGGEILKQILPFLKTTGGAAK